MKKKKKISTMDDSEKKRLLKKSLIRFFLSLTVLTALLFVCFSVPASAAPSISIDLNSGSETGGGFGPLELLFLVTLLSLAPSILIMMTSFTRIIIVLSFLRNALGTQQTPPNQVLIGLALFLTLFIMTPVLGQINEAAVEPYREGKLTAEQAVEKAVVPMKEFMLKQVYAKDLNLFLDISGKGELPVEEGAQPNEALMKLGLEVIVPAFITSELKRAFIIGFLLFLPFLVIDMVVSSTLMSMGMVMLPPSMIALPFKIMVFVVVDGWELLIGNLVSSFQK